MAEHQIRRRWIKLWTQETLHGTTTKELAYDETGTWFLLLCKAGDSPIPGTICIAEGLGYSPEQLATLFKIPIEVYLRAEQKLISHNKISKNGDNTIKIVNWDKYQGFDRAGYMTPYMRDYRVKLTGKTNSKSNSKQFNKVSNEVKPPSKTNIVKLVKLQDNTKGEGGQDNTLDKPLSNKDSGNKDISILNNNSNNIVDEDVFEFYSKNIGMLTSNSVDTLKVIINEYKKEWIIEAIKIADKNQVRKLNYITAILESWNINGFKSNKTNYNKLPVGRRMTAGVPNDYEKELQKSIDKSLSKE